MPDIDYTSLINGEEEVALVEETEETGWTTLTNYDEISYSDPDFSQIDQAKNISIRGSQINLSQEINSQYIPFEMNRYYDGYDLATKAKISIYYVRADNQGEEIFPINVQYSKDKIRFGWLIDRGVTGGELNGPDDSYKVNFEIRARGLNADGNIDEAAYFWRTRPLMGGLVVHGGLTYHEEVKINPDWFQELIEGVAGQITSSAATTTYVDGNFYKKTETYNKTEIDNKLANVKVDLSDYATTAYVDDTAITGVSISLSDEEYKLVVTLQDGKGDRISSNKIDLPLESLIVDGRYDIASKKVILTLQNENTIEIEVADLVSGLASEEHVDEQVQAARDYADEQVQAAKDYADAAVANADIEGKLTNYATKAYVDKAIDAIPATDLTNYFTKEETYNREQINEKIGEIAEGTSVKNYVDGAVNGISNRLEGLTKTDEETGEAVDITVKEYVDTAVKGVDVTEQLSEYAKTDYVNSRIGDLGTKTDEETGEESPIAVKEYVDTAIEATNEKITADITSAIGELSETEDETITVKSYVDNKTSEITARFGDLLDEENNEVTVKEYVDSAVEGVDVSEQLKEYAKETWVKEKIGELGEAANVVGYVDQKIQEVDLTDYYTKQQTDETITTKLSTELNAYATKEYVSQEIASQSGGDTITYDINYNDPSNPDGGENVFVFYEITNAATEQEEKVIKQRFPIAGGSGGSGGVLKISYVTTSPVVAIDGTDVIISYKFEGTDSAGDPINMALATWKVGSRIVGTEEIYSFDDNEEVKINTFDLTPYLNVGTQKVTLTVTDDSGNLTSKNWSVQVLDVRLESDFDDTVKRTANETVTFTYRPYGAIAKVVHLVLDGEDHQIALDASVSGTTQTFTLPAKSHGSYLLEGYITATVNGNTIETEHIYKDILYFNPLATAPVIGCIYQNIVVKQYDTTDIYYTVYDPSTSFPEVSVYVDDELKETKKLEETNTASYKYKESEPGEHIIKLVCGDTTKELTIQVEELGIVVNPVTAGLVFDFNPAGRTNDDQSWESNGVSLIVSDNFDWVNGGYHTDDNGDQYFRVKAGTTATFSHNLFANDAKGTGKEFKVIFKTENIRKRDTAVLQCLDGGIGLEMKVEEANIYSSTGSLYSPYCEEEIIEFEFNINKCKFAENGETTEGKPVVLTYEDGVASRPMVYTSDTSFWQTEVQPIVVGSDDCDVLIYRMKAYETELSDNEILSNFIADARNAEEMVTRYNRNQIYNVSGKLDPETLAKACPDLRIVMIEAPYFTNDKSNKVSDTVVTMRYENGDRYLDNWTCINAKHSGQGTSSNDYGYAGRNLDLIMNGDDSVFTFGDGSTGKTITLTRDSVPVNYLNIKVNIASSENQNNAQFAERYNRFNPFQRVAKLNNSNVKDTMEFYNCVVFIKETSDVSVTPHREFQDNEWHFYAIGNIGDSKKTDKTRVNNAEDAKECVVEIMDYNVSLAEFPTGYGDGYEVCPLDSWKAGNSAYDQLHGLGYEITIGEGDDAIKYDENGYTYKKGLVESFGYGSYEFRYEKEDITAEEQQNNIDAWREFYKFLVTSDDTTFKQDFSKYFVLDSALYFYLFTERYTMVDNRAKNSFWHYGKAYYASTDENIPNGIDAKYINDEQAAFNDGYRWDLTFGYDFDTALGIDNTGKLVLSYGKEDEDQYSDDGTDTRMIYRAAKSNFFTRVKKIFASEMGEMFKSRESAGAWSAEGLINQWDDAQKQFPEELWRLDIQRKYIRTFTGESVDNSIAGAPTPRFLAEMLNGRKKYQRRMFERNQEMYMATKYFGTTATNDKITIRFNNPETYVIKPDFTLRITPYSDMYIGVQAGNVASSKLRAKAGVEYVIPYPVASATADITNIYGAKFIQAIGDLSAGYVGDNDFSKATRLQSLSIGNSVLAVNSGITGQIVSQEDTDGYLYSMEAVKTNVPVLYKNIRLKSLNSTNTDFVIEDFEIKAANDYYYIYLKKTSGTNLVNAVYEFEIEYDTYFNSYMKKLSLGNNGLLEYLDIRNVSGLESAIDLSRCGNLREIQAEGAGAAGIVFANGGRLRTAKLPAVTTLTMKNLREIESFSLAGYNNLQSLVIEGCPAINSYEMLKQAQETLRILRLADINWPASYQIIDGTVLDKALTMRGINASGAEVEHSIVAGTAYLQNIRQSQLNNYKEVWQDRLSVTYEHLIKEYYAYFVNEGKIVDTQLVDEGTAAEDPINRDENPIDTPTKESTIEYRYDFARWDPSTFEPLYGDKYYTAVYNPVIREYTITYSGLGVEPYSETVPYGTMVEYPHGTPTYSASNRYYWFERWNQSGYANKNKTIEPIYDECSYEDGYFSEKELKDLRPVELYMLTKVSGSSVNLKETEYLLSKELNLPFGNDYVYDQEDVVNSVLVSDIMEFNGTNSRLDTNEILFDGKKDFVLAVDFKCGSSVNGTMFECFGPSLQTGFRLNYTETATTFIWDTTSTELENNSKNREMLVLRYVAKENSMEIYYSQKDETDILYKKLEVLDYPSNTFSLVFGCRKTGENSYGNYTSGTVYWSKLWYADLGDTACRKLAAWPHENMTMLSCAVPSGENTGYTNAERTSTLTFIAKNLLDEPKKLSASSYYNTGGWGAMDIPSLLNGRLYNGINEQYQRLLKNTNVNYINQNNEILSEATVQQKIFIPAILELDKTKEKDALFRWETNGIVGTFEIFSEDEYRKCTTTSGVAGSYWTRSLVPNSLNSFYYVAASGKIESSWPADSRYIRIMFTI